MARERSAARRIVTTVLPCGTQVVAYRLKGARTTCVLLRTGSWDAVFDEEAPTWMKPFREVSGHLIEHAAGGVMMGREVEGLQGHWRGSCIEWMIDGTPGETRSMVRVLPRTFGTAASLSQELLAAEWSRVQFEGRHRRDTGFDSRPVDLVQKLLSGDPPASGGACGQDLQADPDLVAAWLRQLPAIAQCWLRPERSLLVIAGPHDPLHSIEYAKEAFGDFAHREPAPECIQSIPEARAPRRIRHQYSGDDPVPAVYAWAAPYLGAYGGALSIIVHAAHHQAMRLCSAAGLAYWVAVGPAAHHVWGAAWCAPKRVDDALALLRRSFFDSLDQLSDPAVLAEAKKRRARQKFRDYLASSRGAASNYIWLRRLDPEARDPFSAHLREIMSVTDNDIRRLREQYGDESLVTTVEYRRPGL